MPRVISIRGNSGSQCMCPTAGGICPKGQDVAGLPLSRVPYANLSCFLTVHDPLKGVNAPPLSWDSAGSLSSSGTPSEWAQRLLAMNPSCKSYNAALRAFIAGLKKVMDVVHENGPPSVRATVEWAANLTFVFDWMTEMERYLDAAFDTHDDEIAKMSDQIALMIEAGGKL